MGPRKKNMLEALAASEAESPQSPQSPLRPRPSGASRASWPSPPAGLDRSTQLVLGCVVAALVLGAAYWLGRQNATVEAGPGPGDGARDSVQERAQSGTPSTSTRSPSADALSRPSDEGDPAPATASNPDSEQNPGDPLGENRDASAAGDLTADDLRFFEKSNRFTVRAIYYGNTPRGWMRALATYRYLRDLGLPAVAPIDQGNELVLCVGAEATREGRLSGFRSRLRALPGPPPSSETGAFAGAYFINIDDLVDR